MKTHSESISLKTLVSKVIPFWYIFEKQCFDSNTVLVLLSKHCFDRHRQFNNTSKNHFETITLKIIDLEGLPFWLLFEKHCFDSNTVLVLLSETEFWQTDVNLKIHRTQFWRYYIGNSSLKSNTILVFLWKQCFDSNTVLVLLSKAVFWETSSI